MDDGTATDTGVNVAGRSAADDPEGQPQHDVVAGTLPHAVRNTVKAFGAALAPPTAAVGLVLFFAVRRQEQVVLHFGIDDSILDYSVQDYLLRGADALFVAILFITIVGLALLRLHAFFIVSITRPQRHKALLILSSASFFVGALTLITGVVGVFIELPLPVYARTTSIGLGIGMLAYAVYIRRRLGIKQHDEPAWLSAAGVILVAVLVFLSVFWTTNELALALGRGHAQALEDNLVARPSVTVFSVRRLLLDGPGVAEEVLTASDNDESAFRYRYEGLKVLVFSNGYYVLVPQGWSENEGSVILLRADEGVRFEFARG